jgi:hypothetical protein
MLTQLGKKFPAFYGLRWFIKISTRNPPWVNILSQMNPIHTSQRYITNVHFNIIIPYTYSSFEWYFLSGFSTKFCVHLLSPHARKSSCPSHTSCFEHPYICWTVQTVPKDRRSYLYAKEQGLHPLNNRT